MTRDTHTEREDESNLPSVPSPTRGQLRVLLFTFLLVASLPVMGISFTNQATAQSSDWQVLQRYEHHTDIINDVEHHDGTLYIASNDGNVTAVDPDTADVLATYDHHTDGVTSLAISDGTLYTGSLDGTAAAVDLGTGTVTDTYSHHSNSIFDVEFESGTLYTASQDQTAAAVNPDTGSVIATYDNHAAAIRDVERTGDTVYTADANGYMMSYDPDTGTHMTTYDPFSHGSTTYDIEIDDETLYAANTNGTALSLDLSGNVLQSFDHHTDRVYDLEVVGNYLFTASRDDTAAAVDIAANSVIDRYDHHDASATEGVRSIDVSEGIVYTGARDGTAAAVQPSFDAVDYDSTTGRVVNESGSPIANATVTFTDAADGSETDTQTGSDGTFSIGVESGMYEVEIVADGYQTFRENRDVEEGEDLGTFELAPQQLDLQFTRFVEPGDSTPYTVEFTGENGTVMDVTGEVSMNSSNTSIATVDTAEVEIVGEEGVNGTSVITANYTVNNTTYTDTRRITVATKTVDNLEILPGTWRFSAVLDDITIQVILVAIGAGIIATRAASSWAGLGAMELVIIIGWFGNWVPIGIAMLGLFTALFIGLNLAANIDYSVRR